MSEVPDPSQLEPVYYTTLTIANGDSHSIEPYAIDVLIVPEAGSTVEVEFAYGADASTASITTAFSINSNNRPIANTIAISVVSGSGCQVFYSRVAGR